VIAVETNGTRPPPRGIDWLTASPKAGAAVVVTAGDELKLVYPQPGRSRSATRGSRSRTFFSSRWTDRTGSGTPR
jgi:hypothetical protein